MELSIFLAKLLGIYMLIVAGVTLVRKNHFETSFREIVSSKNFIILSGLFNLFFGLAIAIAHPFWHFNWIGLITFLGYLMIFSGIMRLMFTEEVQKYMFWILKKGYWPMIAVMIILGSYLTYSGFMIG